MTEFAASIGLLVQVFFALNLGVNAISKLTCRVCFSAALTQADIIPKSIRGSFASVFPLAEFILAVLLLTGWYRAEVAIVTLMLFICFALYRYAILRIRPLANCGCNSFTTSSKSAKVGVLTGVIYCLLSVINCLTLFVTDSDIQSSGFRHVLSALFVGFAILVVGRIMIRRRQIHERTGDSSSVGVSA